MTPPDHDTLRRWRGLRALVTDAVDHGSTAIERIQKETARRPFALLEALPPVAAPAKVVHVLHDAAVGGTHGAIRLVNQVVGTAVDAVIDILDRVDEPPPGAP
ncbi:MAG: hypothetical protein NVS3B10_06400 [Polyangiales bacterium]